MAEKFEYTREWTNAEAFPLLGFTKSWENPEDYPTIELDETQVRKDMQSLHDEVKDYINTKLIPAVLAEDATETARAAAEEARSNAEAERQSAEEARSGAETIRQSNEESRQNNEAARVAAENARVNAESARAQAESGRVTAEEARATAESLRASAEELRASAEQARAAAEQNRVAAEQGRSTAEQSRDIAEQARAASETGRASAETARDTAEQERVAAEQARADENTGIVARATEQANLASSASASARNSASAAYSYESAAASSASSAADSAAAASTSETNARASETAAKAYETAASGSSSSAQESATQAAANSKAAESWAVGGTGTREGEDTNNAKYWCENAQAIAGGGVTSFNGRGGVVKPQKGDYTAEMVGADASGAAAAVQSNLDGHKGDTTTHITAAERTKWNGKQDKLTGTKGQVVGFDADGRPVAQDKPSYTANDVSAVPAEEKGAPEGVATLGTDGKVPKSQLPEISSVKTFTANIGTIWTENADTGVKSQSIAIAGVLAKHTAKVDHAYTGDGTSDGYAAFVEAENQYLTCITNGYAETYNGGITFHIFGDAPTVSIPIVVEVA